MLLCRVKVYVVDMKRVRAAQHVWLDGGGVAKRKGEEARNQGVKEGLTRKEASFAGSEVNSGI